MYRITKEGRQKYSKLIAETSLVKRRPKSKRSTKDEIYDDVYDLQGQDY